MVTSTRTREQSEQWEQPLKERRKEEKRKGEKRRTFLSLLKGCAVVRAAVFSELITQSKCPLCGGLMGHSETRLAVQNLLRNQLLTKLATQTNMKIIQTVDDCNISRGCNNSEVMFHHPAGKGAGLGC